jgi:hypothetical protein
MHNGLQLQHPALLVAVNIPTPKWIFSAPLGIRKLIANNCTGWRGPWMCSQTHRIGDGWILLQISAPLPLMEAFRFIPFSARSISLDSIYCIIRCEYHIEQNFTIDNSTEISAFFHCNGHFSTYRKFFWGFPFKKTNFTIFGGTRKWNC